MKTIAFIVISLYQTIFSVVVKQLLGIEASCRFRPTCSDYTKNMIRTHGVIQGIRLGGMQLMRCHPFTRYATI